MFTIRCLPLARFDKTRACHKSLGPMARVLVHQYRISLCTRPVFEFDDSCDFSVEVAPIDKIKKFNGKTAVFSE